MRTLCAAVGSRGRIIQRNLIRHLVELLLVTHVQENSKNAATAALRAVDDLWGGL